MHRGGERRPLYRFGDVEVDAAQRELRRAGRAVQLAPKPFDLLLLLLGNRHRMVSRREIREVIWPDVRVSEATIASTLRDLRRALGDAGRGSRVVRTVRGIGLRFLAEVEEAEASDALLRSTLLVGRDALVAHLRRKLEALARGEGAVVLLEGEPGIGKTQLLTAAGALGRAAGVAVFYGRCPEAGAAAAYRPWSQVLGAVAAARPPEALAEELGNGAILLTRLIPTLASEPAPAPALERDEGATLRLFDAALAFLRGAARAGPLALVLDDLHCADRSSLRLLEFLADSVGDLPVLLMGAYRSCELDPDHPLAETLAELARSPVYERHRLGGLDLEATRVLVQACVGTEPARQRLVELHERTGGNPFFVRELAGLLREGAETEGTAPWVPSSLRELLRGRLLRLPPVCREVLEAAAVIGREFPVAIVGRATGLTPDQVSEGLDGGRRAGLVEAGWSGLRRFSHGLVQEAVYVDLPPARRRELHRRVGEAFEELASTDRGEQLSAVAHHLCQAAEAVGTHAVEAAVAAADYAEGRLAFEEAARLRDLALDALDRVAPGDRARRCELMLGLARSRLGTREVTSACEAARRVAALARALDDAEHLAEAALILSDHVMVDASEPAGMLEEALPGLPSDATALRARALAALSVHRWYGGPVALRLSLADQALVAARAAGDPEALVEALLARRHALCAPSSLPERLRIESEALREAQRLGSAWRCLVRSWRAVDLLEAGDLAAAERDVEALAHCAEEEHLLRFSGFPHRWRAMRATFEGRLPEAEKHIGDAAAHMSRAEDPNLEAYAGIQLAVVRLEQGRGADLLGLLGRSPWFEAYRERVPAARAALASIELETGQPGAARRLVGELEADDLALLRDDPEPLGTATWIAEVCARLRAERLAAALYERLAPFRGHHAGFYALACRGSMARYLGLLAWTAGRLDDAVACFEEALAANQALGAELYVAWTRWELAGLLTARGRPADRVRRDECAARARRSARRLGLGRLEAAVQAGRSGPGRVSAA
jgi:DNA-binding winged helix-turn-helix (wHTH) protein/tetratricopeptide (TPR) repeat protein